jgi:hypothetical protein
VSLYSKYTMELTFENLYQCPCSFSTPISISRPIPPSHPRCSSRHLPRPPPPPTSLSLSMPVGCRSETWLHTVKPPSSNLNPNYTRAWDADPRLYSRPSRIPSKSPAGRCPLAFLSLLHCCQGLTRRVHTFRQLPLAVATARATGSAERSRTLKKSEKRGLDLQADQTYADVE